MTKLVRKPSGKPEAIAANETDAAVHAVGLLNELEVVMTGWVLGFDRDDIAKILEPLYDALDF